MKRSVLIALGWGWLMCFSLPVSGQQFFQEQMEHGCLSRSYWLYVPSGYSPAEPLPLIMNLHGFRSDPESQAIYSNLNQFAEADRFLALYPAGTIGRTPWGEGTHWNVGFRDSPDDVGFLRELLTEVMNQYAVDPTRIYVMGLSNGGFMAYELACHYPEQIAAVGSVAGTMFPSQLGDCQQGLPVPVIHFHGTEDELVPYSRNLRFFSPQKLLRFWAEQAACTSEESRDLPDLMLADQSQVKVVRHLSCEADAEVVWYQVEGGGHTWPGSAVELASLGITNQDVDATGLMWDFFQRFQRPGARPFLPEPGSPVPCPPIWTFEGAKLHLQWENQPPEAVALYTLDGRLIWQETTPATEIRVDWTFAAGVYLLRYELSGASYWRKLMRWE